MPRPSQIRLAGVGLALVYAISSIRMVLINERVGSASSSRAAPGGIKVNHQESQSVSSAKPSQEQLLSLFSSEQAPIIKAGKPDKPVRIRILLFEHKKHPISFRPGPNSAISDELLNICKDGFERSPLFDLVDTTVVPDFTVQPDFLLPEDEDIVWVADMRRTVVRHSYTIHRQLVHLAQSTLDYQQKQQQQLQRRQQRPKLTVVLMDYRDRIPSMTLCTKATRELIHLLGHGNVRSVLQQIVRGRYWSDDQQFPIVGQIWDSSRDNKCFGAPTLHVGYMVRSDYAEAVLAMYPSFLSNHTNNEQSPVDTVRPIDVAHFWGKQGRSEAHAKLRNAVTDRLLTLRKTRPWNITADFVSVAAKQGRTQVSNAYVTALLTTKIVVVAQRDDWEDHYRLFEAIVGGALVMTDPMQSLPEGLVDGKSVIVYKSLAHLEQLLEYYLAHENERLAIARQGFNVAMSRHRTYHWMEKLFFGQSFSV